MKDTKDMLTTIQGLLKRVQTLEEKMNNLQNAVSTPHHSQITIKQARLIFLGDHGKSWLSDHTIRTDVNQEIPVPEGTQSVQIFFNR